MALQTPSQTPKIEGLSQEQVDLCISKGQVNTNTDVKTKSIPQIISSNCLTLFNAVNLVLAVLVYATGQYRNLLFVVIVLANLAVGIVQEIKSKRAVDRLKIMTAKKVLVIREGQEQQVNINDLVLGDCICLSHGNQIPADSVVIQGDAQVNESLLTGESRSVAKTVGSELMSGSFIESGSVIARVSRVGADGYAAKINAQAKYVKPITSEILSTLKGIITMATYAMVPIGIFLFMRSYLISFNYTEAILPTVAAVIGMMPQGLVLLTSSVLAIATIRLARHQVLIQQMYCVEVLARVDTLCLDKTGTITTGAMEVKDVAATDGASASDILQILANICEATKSDVNETSRAIGAYLAQKNITPDQIAKTIAFSSATKFSGCTTKDGKSYVMGAPQFILKDDTHAVFDLLNNYPQMCRKLIVCEVGSFDDDGKIAGSIKVLGAVILTDQIRSSAKETIAFFAKQNVELKVISGDDPTTVSAIAQQVGIPGADRYIDASTLKTDEDIARAIVTYQVFGRVTPYQKRKFVQALHKLGKTVAMTGDGVNDILALKEADCSVAMASGSEAASAVSDIVLCDSDFSHFPEVVAEGRRSINNLQRSAALFLVKTVYSILLGILCIFVPPYPFIPIQLSLISGLIIGMPSFVLALEPNYDRVEGDFSANVLSRSLPASVAVVFGISATIAAGNILQWGFGTVSTMCTYITAAIGFALIVKISWPPTKLRKALIATIALLFCGACFVFGNFFKIAALKPMTSGFVVLMVACGLIIFVKLFRLLTYNEKVLARLLSTIKHMRVFRNVVHK